METSKLIILMTMFMSLLVVLICGISVIVNKDTVVLEFLITGVFGLSSTSLGFYLWKAKNENIAKYGNNVKENDDENNT